MHDNNLTYYVNENEDILNFLSANNISLPLSVQQQLAFISKKTSNNYIGFYQFMIEGKYVKFFIIPKIHKGLTDPEKEANFFNFLAKYYELSDKYPQIKYNKIQGNIIDLVFNDFKKENSSRIDDFIRYKYQYALNTLDKFFRKHNKTRTKITSYSSQSIINRIDLRRNVLNIDKSNVYQIKKEVEPYSTIALITIEALQRFKKEKVVLFVKDFDILNQKTNSILNCINKKYKYNPNFVFKDRDIITNRIMKLFKRNNELKDVFEALLIIIGLEHFKSEDYSSEIQKLHNMLALFFRPEDLYEWIVYDYLKFTYPQSVIFNDAINKETSEDYHLETSKGKYIRKSEPDFIVLDNGLMTIVDAKWKILEVIDDIKFGDISKLERDYILRKQKYQDNQINAHLIYPKIQFDPSEYNPISQSSSPDFEFEILEVKAV